MNGFIREHFGYAARDEEGTQTPLETLADAAESLKDSSLDASELRKLARKLERVDAQTLTHHVSVTGGKELSALGESINAMLERNEAMIRTIIGEARRHPAHAKQVIQEAVRPARDAFIAYLTSARREGRVRKDVKLPAAVDMFTGMLLSGMLRRTSHGITDYTTKHYLDTCLEIFVSGIEAQATSRKRKS